MTEANKRVLVSAPVRTFGGTAGGVRFVNGQAKVPADHTALAYFERQGYTIEAADDSPLPKAPELPAPFETIVDGRRLHAGHYDENGIYHLPGGGTLSPDGIYRDRNGEQIHGSVRFRICRNDGALAPAIPATDGTDPVPPPPLVPTSLGWPTPPEGFGWPNLDNPNWND